ncbi:hypothetical protein A2348_01220 [Candidatus Uhrbacteria bacterium RIFOXYB12_FULL_58_10]|uniref:Uncharacterized protein n=1 Tax=Candidatus Uhrbacteria bacterium RIFOXYB2_FULL_57_15 TaxID=1802422 RepID=A0A1F7WA27_9BACT|nr:MAG: hypothetical protein A2348_01220 [Candidatus Uhrbacteria bacterium RIFOXYB12_FULL_58_10]OGL99037.1 MAG: hypothetical protein A2304_02735 [Candidatus Uhrbacteria bacterium RIFOXYB2_FULL_57_15]OGM00258.1 MAG: hypothetical protein A2501_01865 [Candidatus Uhrbacteria bacterium RIFOXYC12_FULL_57_11]
MPSEKEELKGAYIPFGKNDVLALPIHVDADLVALSIADANPGTFLVYAAVAKVDGKGSILLRHDRLDGWTETHSGAIERVVAIDDDVEISQGDSTTGEYVMWGGEPVTIPDGGRWWIGTDQRTPTLIVQHGAVLTRHFVSGRTETFDASNVIPAVAVLDEELDRVVFRDGIPYFEARSKEPRVVGDAQTRVFECGGELVAVDYKDPKRPWINTLTSVADGSETLIADAPIRVIDISGTDLHWVITFDVNVSGKSNAPGDHRRQIMVLNRDGSRRVAEEDDAIRDRWSPTDATRSFVAPDGFRVVLVEMGRRTENGDAQRGVMIYTDTGHIFHVLRGVAFETLHLVEDEIWGWRRCPGGVILSRFPFLRD